MRVSDHARTLLERHGRKPQKHLGQNFLMDAGAAARIAHLAVESLDGRHTSRVVEIGAGTGTLTRALLDAGANLTAIEIDRALVEILLERDDLKTAAVITADALTFDFAAFAASGPFRVAGNLPYNVATPLIVRLVEMDAGPEAIVAMIQRDVAARLAARPGTAAYGSLSVAVQYTMNVERAFSLRPHSFHPRPKVESTVVRLVRRDEPLATPRNEAFFRQVVRGAFAYRRKTLGNSLALSLGISRASVAAALRSLDLDTEIRGEHLTIAQFAGLADRLGS